MGSLPMASLLLPLSALLLLLALAAPPAEAAVFKWGRVQLPSWMMKRQLQEPSHVQSLLLPDSRNVDIEGTMRKRSYRGDMPSMYDAEGFQRLPGGLFDMYSWYDLSSINTQDEDLPLTKK